MYIRKTKDIYVLVYQGEEIDTAEHKTEAAYLKREYNAAFHGGVTLKIKRVPK